MTYRLLAIMIALSLFLAACGGAEEPLPTLASVDEPSTTTEENTDTANNEEPAEVVEESASEETAEESTEDMTTTDDSAATTIEIGITDDLSPPEMTSEVTITAMDSEGLAYNLTFELPDGWSAEGDTITNGTINITAEVWAAGGDAINNVIEGTYPGAVEDIVFAQNIDYITLVYAYDTNTNIMYISGNTSGSEAFNPYTALVSGSVADIQANLRDILAITDAPAIALQQ